MLALHIHESSTVLGVPTNVAYDASKGEFLEGRSRINYAARAIEEAQRANPNPEPGTEYYLVDAREGWSEEDWEVYREQQAEIEAARGATK